jgi:hypothetical protein
VISHGELDLAGLFKSRRLLPGTRISVNVVQNDWIGKRFVFVVEKGRAPRVETSCLEPSSVSVADSC